MIFNIQRNDEKCNLSVVIVDTRNWLGFSMISVDSAQGDPMASHGETWRAVIRT